MAPLAEPKIQAVPKGRLEAFADGFFAFAATLLVVNLAVDQKQPLGPQLLEIWPSYVAYAISFITIGIVWANHHTFMHQIAQVDRFFILATVLFLMFIAFIPFPTRLLALDIRSVDAKAAALLYGITLTGLGLFQRALALRSLGQSPAETRRRPANGRRHQPQLSARADVVHDRHPRCPPQPAGQRRDVRSDRGLLHRRELDLRTSRLK